MPKKRELYKLTKLHKDCVEVLRKDNNYGVQGYVYKDGRISKRYPPYAIPNYIVEECLNILN